MKGKINGNGRMRGRRECGDWCPAFGEPFAEVDAGYAILPDRVPETTGKTILNFCCGSLEFEELEDLR
jgi:hypothetical protein